MDVCLKKKSCSWVAAIIYKTIQISQNIRRDTNWIIHNVAGLWRSREWGGQHFIIHSIFHIYFRTCQCDGTKMQREVQNKSDDTLWTRQLCSFKRMTIEKKTICIKTLCGIEYNSVGQAIWALSQCLQKAPSIWSGKSLPCYCLL